MFVFADVTCGLRGVTVFSSVVVGFSTVETQFVLEDEVAPLLII